jgi:hypothetical protein
VRHTKGDEVRVLTIHKYQLDATTAQELSVTKEGRILSVAEQRNNIVVYAMVDTDEQEKDHYEVFVIGTGHHIPLDALEGRFLGTVNLHGGSLMFHVFIKHTA